MNIRELLLESRSKANCERIVRYIQSNPQEMQQFMDCMLSSDLHLNEKAAWVLHFFEDHAPEMLDPWQEQLLKKCKEPDAPDAVKRAVMRLWGDHGYPEQIEGEVYDLGIRFLEGQEAIAIKAHAMFACLRLVKKYPELKPEFEAALTATLERDGQESAGIRSRGNKVMKLLEKL